MKKILLLGLVILLFNITMVTASCDDYSSIIACLDYETNPLGWDNWTNDRGSYNLLYSSDNAIKDLQSGKIVSTSASSSSHYLFTQQYSTVTLTFSLNSSSYGSGFFISNAADGPTYDYETSHFVQCRADGWRYYDGSAYQLITSPCTLGQVYNFTTVAHSFGSDSKMDYYIDGTSYKNNTESRGNVASIGGFGFFQGSTSTNIFIDELVICSGNHTGGCATSFIPEITLITPINNYHINSSPVELHFNVTDEDSDIVNCTVNVDDSIITTLTDLNITSDPNIYYNLSLSEGSYNWSINCTDGDIISYSDVYNITLDSTKPIWTIRTIETDNSSIFNVINKTNIEFNDSLNDTYLFAYNISIRYPNSSLYYSNQTTGLLVDNINFTFNVSLPQITGNYTINYYAEDDHTINSIPDYEYNILSDGYFFSFDNYYINIKSDNPSSLKSLSTDKLTDRYTFNIEYKTPSNIRYYSLKSDEHIYYRENLYNFPSFVIGKNWVDFNLLDNSVIYRVIYKNDNWYQIEVETINPSAFNNIKSLGGLNFANETYTFEIINNTAPTVAPIITPTSADSNSILTCEENGFDINNNTITYEYLWYESNIIQPFTTNQIQADNLTSGQLWVCSVRGYDGYVKSNYVNSSSKLIQAGGAILNVDLEPVEDGIRMIGTIVILALLFGAGFWLKKGSIVMLASIYGFIMFLIDLEMHVVQKIVGMGIMFSLLFVGYKMVRAK